MIKKIIINADDFGLKPSVNKAIVASFNAGLINSTTIMANMPYFEEAAGLAKTNDITNKIGIHLTLTKGYPLTSNILNTNLFMNTNSSDHKQHIKTLFFLTKNEKQLIFDEFAAQIEKVKNAGIQITHIDTHHHIDDVWPITQIILKLLKAYNIPSMRILNNLNRSTNFYKSAYRTIVNEFIKFKKANFSDFFGDLPESLTKLRNSGTSYNQEQLEIMVHPDYNDNGILINRIKNQEVVFDYSEDIKVMFNNLIQR